MELEAYFDFLTPDDIRVNPVFNSSREFWAAI